MKGILHAICDAIRTHRSFQIVGHVRPDADCIGSTLALYYILRQLGKHADVCIPGPILEHYFFTPGIQVIRPLPDPMFEPDVTIYLDCSSLDRSVRGFVPKGLLINIDHHHTNERFGKINYVDPGACAAGEQVFHIAQQLGARFTPEIGNNLYLAILGDTGGFRFSNTNTTTFQIAAELSMNGADPSWVAREYFSNRSYETIQLSSEVLLNVHFEFEGKLVWGEITQEMYMRFGGEKNEPESLVGDMRRIKGVEVSILIHELTEGGLRAGFRSKESIDVSEIATALGGGGHPNASGCFCPGDYTTMKENLLKVTRQHLSTCFQMTPLPPDIKVKI